MDAVLATCRGKKLLNVFYTSTETDWDKMAAAAKQQCNVGNERCQIFFTPQSLREVFNGAGR